jgi:hypothetical protein
MQRLRAPRRSPIVHLEKFSAYPTEREWGLGGSSFRAGRNVEAAGGEARADGQPARGSRRAAARRIRNDGRDRLAGRRRRR